MAKTAPLPDKPPLIPFTGYQKFVIFAMAVTMFTVVLDFMVMSPLGDMLMKSLTLKPSDFGFAVSAYAFSAGISGLLTAGFADKYDRKKLLLFFYIGFIVGTACCGLAHTYQFLLVARIITGLFGGVIGSIAVAIVTDLFALNQRGRVMGFVQMGFGASQVLGVPIGLFLANAWGWEAAFWMVAGLSTVIAILISVRLKPVVQHLLIQQKTSALKHLWGAIAKRNYRIGFTSTALLSIGGFMMMPFGSAFAINNLGITNSQLPILFMVSGVCSLIVMPMVGRLSDRVDKFKIFMFASIWLMCVVVLYTHLGVTPLWEVMLFNVVMMMGIISRMIPSSALTSAIPDMADRGAFMSINSSLQQIAGGIAAAVAGVVVLQPGKGQPLQHYDHVGYIIVVISILSIILMSRVSSLVKRKAVVSEVPVIMEG